MREYPCSCGKPGFVNTTQAERDALPDPSLAIGTLQSEIEADPDWMARLLEHAWTCPETRGPGMCDDPIHNEVQRPTGRYRAHHRGHRYGPWVTRERQEAW